MNSIIEEIKNRLDLVDVISSYLKLEKTGANYRALCPFHNEKTPSFFVSPAKQIFKCFGCGVAGDVFKFVILIENIEFPEALKILAEKAGVELKKYDFKKDTLRQKLLEINEIASRFFQKQLRSKNGQEAEKYLLSRGINKKSIEEWEIGYAPNKWEALRDFLSSKGYNEEEIEKAGLIIKGEKGYYDRFRGRIIFPIWNINSQVVGFAGRIFEKVLGDEGAKYLNIPNTPVYDKSKILYGIDKAKLDAREKDFFILVEGYTDVILAHQIGDKNTVATCGTALTDYHLRLLGRYTKNLYLCFDMDLAGESATKRGIDLALSRGFNLKVILLPEGKDPAELIKNNPDLWRKALEEGKSIMEFYLETALSRADKNSLEGKKQISEWVLPVIKKIPNKIEQGFWVQRLSQELKMGEKYIYEELKRVETEEPFKPEKIISLPQDKKTKFEFLEEEFLKLLLNNLYLIDKVKREVIESFSTFTKNIYDKIEKITLEKKEVSDWNEFSDVFSEEELEKINTLVFEYELEKEGYFNKERKGEEVEKEFLACQNEIQRISLKERLSGLLDEIKIAEEEGNSQKAADLLKEFHSLRRKIEELDLS